ncbi:Histidine kinase [bacterium A37T11]|nr:Histidine kinase [bacterium A37T11]
MKKLQNKVWIFLKRHKFGSYQVLYWIFYFLMTMVKNNDLKKPWPWWGVLIIDAMVFIMIYTIVLIFRKASLALHKRLVILITLFIAYTFLYYYLIFVKLPEYGIRIFNEAAVFTWPGYLFLMFVYYFHSMIEAGLLAAIYRVRGEEKEKRKAQDKYHQAQLQFLMAQLSPHFTYNFDNKVLAIATRTSQELVKPLEQRAKVLRYVTEHAGKFTLEVPLKEEVDYAQKLAAAYGFAHSGTQLNVRLHDDRLGHTIIPMLSSPLLENACEYGIYWDAENPITLNFYGTANSLRIVCRNKINPIQSHHKSTGIGLSNLRKRLKLVYGARATLKIVNDGVFYEVNINIYYEEKTNR